jgi:hypothetical protein
LENSALSVDIFDKIRSTQNISGFDLTADELLSILAMYDRYGLWRLDLESGLVYWSRDVYEIHGLEYSDGPVNLTSAINSYHPEDATVISQLIEETISEQSGFRFVLRLKIKSGGFKLVKSSGKYRVNSEGKAELIGLFSQFAPAMRSIATSHKS